MPQRINAISRPGVFQDLGLLEYTRALALQETARQNKIADRTVPDTIFFVQHPSVFTFGRNGGKENLTVSEDFLKDRGVTLVQTDRGGNVTYHGPGQAVLYPVVDLEQARIGVTDFVHGLEEIMGQTARDFGVSIHRDHKNHGMWKGARKIGSVGLSIKHGISIHGLALNVSMDLTPFSWINPCGMSGLSMTSLKQELEDRGLSDPPLPMDLVKESMITYFCQWFHFHPAKESVHA
jgi:lipoyl(octanoyl) transferase